MAHFMLSKRKLRMNKYKTPILLLLFAVLTGCQLDIEPGTPGCIQEKIKEFSKNQISCDRSKTVSNYSFQDEIVYVFDQRSCGSDMTAEVFDSNCNYLGFLGGIAGISEINGEEFSNATFKGVIWKN